MADTALADIASHRLSNEEKLQSLRHSAGFSWNRKITGAVGSREPSASVQRAAISSVLQELAEALKTRLRRIWFASLGLSVEEPRKWRNLIATVGVSGRASWAAWTSLRKRLHELLISATIDLAELGADQLHIVSDHEESNRLLAQLW